MLVQRRKLLLGSLSFPLIAACDGLKPVLAAPATVGAATAFDQDTVAKLAQALAARAYVAPDKALPAWMRKITYDQFRDFRFRPERALWRDEKLPFQAQFFHRGWLFNERIDMYVVDGGRAARLAYGNALFDYGKLQVPREPGLGFSGVRVHAPLNNPAYFDELCVFLGASYFRAVAKDLAYGLSARGLALGSGDPEPEEFPLFKAFWLEQPAPGATRMRMHALMDSPSVAGAFSFDIAPGVETTIDVDARLYPRKTLANAGIAPLTSMFFFDAGDRAGIDDFREAVHDSDGLAVLNGAGEQLWRPLRNHASLQHSGLQDRDPRGFGLMQRKRRYEDYIDGEANYHKRPSAWIEPQGQWGEGEVHLVEIPTATEYMDNIVAFWRPRAPLEAGREHRWRYRIHWCADHAWKPELARAMTLRAGAASQPGGAAPLPEVRLFVIGLEGGRLAGLARDAQPKLQVSASAGEVRNAVAYRDPHGPGWLASFELDTEKLPLVELRAQLVDGQGALSETWLYRWTA